MSLGYFVMPLHARGSVTQDALETILTLWRI
jgi:hypothetical protein